MRCKPWHELRHARNSFLSLIAYRSEQTAACERDAAGSTLNRYNGSWTCIREHKRDTKSSEKEMRYNIATGAPASNKRREKRRDREGGGKVEYFYGVRGNWWHIRMVLWLWSSKSYPDESMIFSLLTADSYVYFPQIARLLYVSRFR